MAAEQYENIALTEFEKQWETLIQTKDNAEGLMQTLHLLENLAQQTRDNTLIDQMTALKIYVLLKFLV